MKLTKNQSSLVELIKKSGNSISVHPAMYKNGSEHYRLDCADGITRSLEGVSIKSLIKKSVLTFTDKRTLVIK